MALAVDPSSPAIVTGTANPTTSSFTAPANVLLVAFYAQDTSGQSQPTIADSGGLVWTLRVRLCVNVVGQANTPTPTGTAQSGQIAIWTATATTSVARTVTVTKAGSGGTGKESMLAVKVFTATGGAPTVGALG